MTQVSRYSSKLYSLGGYLYAADTDPVHGILFRKVLNKSSWRNFAQGVAQRKGRKKCDKGYPCGEACISTEYECHSPSPGQEFSFARWLRKTTIQAVFFREYGLDAVLDRGREITAELEALGAKVDLSAMTAFRQEMLRSGLSGEEAKLLASMVKITGGSESEQEEIRSLLSDAMQLSGGVDDIKEIQIDPTIGRSYANKPARLIVLSKYYSPTTLFHEYGHHIEYVYETIGRTSSEWIDRRATGREPQWLGGYFDTDEVALPGNFIHPYVGRIYYSPSNGERDRTMTEVISMGFERLISPESMLRFWQEDKEHFQFVVGIIRAKDRSW